MSKYRKEPCPVCGVDTRPATMRLESHRCSKIMQNRIDRADDEAWDRELDPTRYEVQGEGDDLSVLDRTLEGLALLGWA